MLATQAPARAYFDTSATRFDGGFQHFGTAKPEPGDQSDRGVGLPPATRSSAAQTGAVENGAARCAPGTPAPLYAATDYSSDRARQASRLVALLSLVGAVRQRRGQCDPDRGVRSRPSELGRRRQKKTFSVRARRRSPIRPSPSAMPSARCTAQTFTYYVATSGSDSNAGTSGSPGARCRRPSTIWPRSATSAGRAINVAAGTASSAHWQTRSVNPVQVLGVSSWNPEPDRHHGRRRQHRRPCRIARGRQALRQDIWVKNTTDNVADAQEGSQLYVQDCWMTDAVGGSSDSMHLLREQLARVRQRPQHRSRTSRPATA